MPKSSLLEVRHLLEVICEVSRTYIPVSTTICVAIRTVGRATISNLRIALLAVNPLNHWCNSSMCACRIVTLFRDAHSSSKGPCSPCTVSRPRCHWKRVHPLQISLTNQYRYCNRGICSFLVTSESPRVLAKTPRNVH